MKALALLALAILLCAGSVRAQFPPDLLPPSRAELGDSTAAVRDSVRAAQAAAEEAQTAAELAQSLAEADSARIDSLYIIRKPAAEITRPGYFAAPTDSGYWKLADTLVTTKAGGVFLDSVAAGDSVNIQYHGLISFARWSGLLSIGEEAVSDSTDAGWLCPTDSMRTNTKKMQTYGVALDATTLMLRFGEVWVWQE